MQWNEIKKLKGPSTSILKYVPLNISSMKGETKLQNFKT